MAHASNKMLGDVRPDLRKNFEERERRRADAGDRPNYTGPRMGTDKFRMKEANAREKREAREMKQKQDQILWAEQKAK